MRSAIGVLVTFSVSAVMHWYLFRWVFHPLVTVYKAEDDHEEFYNMSSYRIQAFQYNKLSILSFENFFKLLLICHTLLEYYQSSDGALLTSDKTIASCKFTRLYV